MPRPAPTASWRWKPRSPKSQWNRADRRDEDKIYNPMPVSALKTLAPDFAWDAFLAGSRISR